jgi:hypothetical protein
MASVSAACWLVEFDAPVDETLLRRFASLLASEAVKVVKEGRNGPSNVDIRPGIFSIEETIPPIAARHPPFVRGVRDYGCRLRCQNTLERNSPYEGEMSLLSDREDCAPAGGISMFLAAGSRLNIRPELVVQAALGSASSVKAITRLELFTLVNERHTPLYEICIGGDFDERGENHTG